MTCEECEFVYIFLEGDAQLLGAMIVWEQIVLIPTG